MSDASNPHCQSLSECGRPVEFIYDQQPGIAVQADLRIMGGTAGAGKISRIDEDCVARLGPTGG